jgi:tetratricopeptide (TPR) repeat protein
LPEEEREHLEIEAAGATPVQKLAILTEILDLLDEGGEEDALAETLPSAVDGAPQAGNQEDTVQQQSYHEAQVGGVGRVALAAGCTTQQAGVQVSESMPLGRSVDGEVCGANTGWQENEESGKNVAGSNEASDALQLLALSKAKKEAGNVQYQNGHFAAALELYSEALELDHDNHFLFANRSACCIELALWSMAASDAAECIQIEPSYIKGYARLCKAQIKLEKYAEARVTVAHGFMHDPANPRFMALAEEINLKQVRLSPLARHLHFLARFGFLSFP